MAKWKANIRSEHYTGGDVKAQWLSKEGETLEDFKKRMRADGINIAFYDFTQV